MENPLLFLLAVLAILGMPGPTNTLLATASAGAGWRRGLILLPAELAGYLVAILVLRAVLGPVVAASASVSVAMRLAVGAWLFLLAWRLWRHGVVVEGGVRSIIGPRQVFVTTLLNPKAIVFALGVIPFGAAHAWPYVAGFALRVPTVGAGWLGLGSGIGRLAEAGRRGQWVPRIGAAAIGMFAALIVVSPLLR